jgi:hypothetical protein
VANRIVTLPELNRATLARQMLPERELVPVTEAVERLTGLQAQVPKPPYIGLWTRLRGFHREDLPRLMQERRVVSTTLMHSILHLVPLSAPTGVQSLLLHLRGCGRLILRSSPKQSQRPPIWGIE